MLEQLGDELRFVLITSSAQVHAKDVRPSDAIQGIVNEQNDLWRKVAPSEYSKCVRCWHLREDVGADIEHPELCGRCIENIAGTGEQRSYA